MISKKELEKARDNYLIYNTTPPQQFNLNRLIDEEGNITWKCEFHEKETCWNEGFLTWLSGEDALNLFFSCDPEDAQCELWDEELHG